MHRFYVDRVDGNTVALMDEGQLHHLKDVLRLKTATEVIICDKAGNEYRGAISAIEKKQVFVIITAPLPPRESHLELAIACAIPKGDRMDDIIDQLTQLGVARIFPMLTARVVVKLDEARKASRLVRWRAIAQSAAGQSRRNTPPFIGPVTDIADVISQSGQYDLKLIPHLEGGRRVIRDTLAGAKPENILALIGPEGDFTTEEVGLALKAGFIPVSLGDTVLRVATAAAAVASYIKFALGD